MKICIICTWFAPDTAIAAKRPYMFAKYLSEFGHNVIVIRSGEINNIEDNHFSEEKCGFKVLTYLDEKYIFNRATVPQSKTGGMPFYFKKLIHFMYEPLRIIKIWKRTNFHYKQIKKVIDTIDETTTIDIVFSTYGELANIKAGKYAKNKFGCPWILDFRDRVIQPSKSSKAWNALFAHFEKEGIAEADAVTTVSNDLFFDFQQKDAKFHTIYNGYEEGDLKIEKKENHDNGKLIICYTGQLYITYSKCLHFFFSVLKELDEAHKINLGNVEFRYAGPNGSEINKVSHKYGLDAIVKNYGYVTSNTISKLQQESDVFVVFSWNTKTDRGILTGKLYEGIKFKKQILAIVSGNETNSELYKMNCEYNFGCCIELCKETGKQDLWDYITSCYDAKMNKENLDNRYGKVLVDQFDYRNLTRKLENVIYNVVKSNK